MTRQLLSNGRIVHIAMKRDLRALLAVAYCDNVEVFCKFLKHNASVVFAIEKYCVLLTAAAVKGHLNVVRELLKAGAYMKVPKQHG